MKTVFGILLFFSMAAFAEEWRYSGDMPASDMSDMKMESENSKDSTEEMALLPVLTLPTDAPSNNMTMDMVLDAVGEPQQMIDPVGEPPITRWQYTNYMVYFERDRVITAVGFNNAL